MYCVYCETPPPRRTKEILTGTWDKESYPHATLATYNCRPGYIKLGRVIFECRNGVWHHLHPYVECRNKPCGHPGDIQFGSFELTAGTEFVFGARVQYKCDEGYQMLSQRNFRECQADGWSNELPHCEVITCVPPRLNNGNLMTPVKVYRENERLQFTCNAGYTFGERSDAECTEYGWSPKPFCKEIRCDPPTVTNGTYHPKKKVFRELEAIRVECNQGFHFEMGNRDRRAECTKNGWLPIPRCILRPCDYPHIENGALTEYYEYYKERAFPAQLGVGIYYRCLDGYVSEREERWPLIRCTKVGWSPAPKCLKKCSPGYLENGRFLSSYWNTYKEGDEISYVCSTHNLETRVTCTKNGWSPTPTCTSTSKERSCSIELLFFTHPCLLYIL
uniref:Sushi domain-containing protein n=1 Tax=Gopherus evgoodei TaxID=1825980 RepID=A0A8C4W1P7_9SAUR